MAPNAAAAAPHAPELRAAASVENYWQTVGIAREHPVIFYCGSGWRSSVAFFFAKCLLGWPDVRNYDGGWLEWSELHPDAPKHAVVVPAEAGEALQAQVQDTVTEN